MKGHPTTGGGGPVHSRRAELRRGAFAGQAYAKASSHWNALSDAGALKRDARPVRVAAVALGGALAFVDAEELPGAVRPSGFYTREGNQVTVTVNLVRDGKKLTSLKVKGSASKIEELGQQVSGAIAADLPTLLLATPQEPSVTSGQDHLESDAQM